MRKRVVQAVLLSVSIAIVALADPGSSPSVRQDGTLVQVQASEAFVKFVPQGKPLRLTLVDGRLGQTSVVGVASRTLKNGLAITTSGTLAFLPERGTQVIFSAPSADAKNCFPAEFGIDCWGPFA